MSDHVMIEFSYLTWGSIQHNPVSKKNFGGIPNSCNVLFLQIFLKHAAKPSAGNASAGFP
jgi:hypothetical protein